jgi:hypothetical protein
LSKRKIIEQLHVSKTTIDEVLLNLWRLNTAV